MTLKEIRALAMFQSNNDEEDLPEFQPALDQYINEGYDRLVEAYTDEHTDPDGDVYIPLTGATDEPEIPSWSHRAIADYATYMIYRNGNVTKQNRSVPYYQSFSDMLLKLREAGVKDRNKDNGGLVHFKNLYVD